MGQRRENGGKSRNWGGGEWRWEREGRGETREQWLRGPVAEGAREAGPADRLSVPFSAGCRAAGRGAIHVLRVAGLRLLPHTPGPGACHSIIQLPRPPSVGSGR